MPHGHDCDRDDHATADHDNAQHQSADDAIPTTQPPTTVPYVAVQVGTFSHGSVPVLASATLTKGGVPGAGQPVSFDIGGGCSPVFSSARTSSDGRATVQLSCPVGTAATMCSATRPRCAFSGQYHKRQSALVDDGRSRTR